MKDPDPDSLKALSARIDAFVKERDWGKYHDPKNLSMGVAIEAAELMEHFQWLTPAQAKKRGAGPGREAIEDEVADVAVYAIQLARVLGFDLGKAILRKLEKNARKYPADEVRGKAHKYTYYKDKGRKR